MSATTVWVCDESTTGEKSPVFSIELPAECVTVRELIRSRVYQEVNDFNHRQPQVYQGLVEPAESEQILNDPQTSKPRELDWHKQFELALEAFRRFQIVLLIDNRQIGDLDSKVTVKSTTQVTFLKLIPIVGG